MYQLHDGQSLIQSARIIQAANMCRNFSFCIAFLLLVHMSSAILTGASNSEEFKISKVASSSLESIDDKADKTAIRSKRGFDYSDYSPESSEENIAYFHRPQYIAYPSHWPHHSQHRLPPTPHTDLSWRRKRRNSISVDDVDDEENDAVFPSRPFFISKGRLRSYETIAVPLSVGTANFPKRQEQKDSPTLNDKTAESFIAPSISYEYHDKAAIEPSTVYQHSGYRRSDTTSYNEKYTTSPPSASLERHYTQPESSYKQPPPPPPSPHYHYPQPPPPPPHHHYYPPPPPPPHHHHHHLPPHYYQYPPPPHHTQYYSHYPPPPPPPYYSHYPPPYPPPPPPPHYPPPPPPSQSYPQQEYTPHTPSYSDESNNGYENDNPTKNSDLNGKIQEIFGSSITNKHPDITSLIDIRKFE